MNQTFSKSNKNTSSLPKINGSLLGQSKLFNNKEELIQTKKLFLERLDPKQHIRGNGNAEEQNQRNQIRSFIQFPRQMTSMGFTSFQTINKNQKQQILQQLKVMRSQSTQLKPFVKAEILFNKASHQKIQKSMELKIIQERKMMAKRIKQLTPTLMNKQIKIKQKYQKKSKNVKKITLSFNDKIYQNNLHCWKPYVDYDSVAIGIKQQIFFVGGRKKAPVCMFNVIEQKWRQLPQIKNMTCFGETDPCVIQNKKILCFGGYDYFQLGFSMITNCLRTIDIKAFTFELQQFSEIKAPYRAFHSQCIYGKFLIISGGIDKYNKVFNTFMNYNYQKKFWNQLTIQKMPQRLQKLGFAKHQTLSIFHERAMYSIYDNQPITQRDQSIKQQGIYIFGGQDSNAELYSSVYIMRLGQPAIIIQELKIAGIGPHPRRNSRMIRHKDYLIIHGGRNDEMKPSILNSIYFLSLRNLQWIKIAGQKTPYRCSHALTVVNDSIVVLGGKGLEGLCKQVYVMPYEQTIQYI